MWQAQAAANQNREESAPPIPARRQLPNQPSHQTPAECNESQDTQTHSAPSSPTHDDLPVPPPRIPSNQRQTSPTSRPKSMAVSSTKYAEIVLDNASKRPTPRQRTTVKYSQIVKPGQRTTSDHSTDSSSAGESAERAEEVTYDVPPSSIAARVVNPLAELPPVSVFDNNFLPPLPPKETNPFMSESEMASLPLDPSQDPFTGFEISFPSYDGASNWNNEFASTKPPPVTDVSGKAEEVDGSIYRDNFNTDNKTDIEDSLALQ